MPINPPYKLACELKRLNKLAKPVVEKEVTESNPQKETNDSKAGTSVQNENTVDFDVLAEMVNDCFLFSKK